MRFKHLPIILLVSLAFTSGVNTHSNSVNQVELKGVVMIDDTHSNDYADGDMNHIKSNLEEEGYIVDYVSNYSSWEVAVGYANYLVISAPYTAFSTSDISAVKSWMDDTSGNLVVASRGDFSSPEYASINQLLFSVGSSSKVQDDNIYTTDPQAWREWYIDTDNFNTEYTSIFSGVGIMSFFSPSSVNPGSAITLVHAEKQAYQRNENGDPAAVTYDDTPDGTGGDSIPLVTLETVSNGGLADRVVVFGTTMWSDFDYSDSDAGDTQMFLNLLDYLKDETKKIAGSIDIRLPDETNPEVDIIYPRNGATLNGIVKVKVQAFDAYGIESVTVMWDDEVLDVSEEFSLDTTAYSEGVHELKVTAKDTSGLTTDVVYKYNVDQDYAPVRSSTSKFMTYNIEESGIAQQWLDVVKEENPDTMILVETGDFDDNSNAILEQVIEDLNLYFIDEVPYTGSTLQGIEDPYDGITIITRFTLDSVNKIDRVTLDSGSMQSVSLPFLHASIEIGEAQLEVIGGHLTCCTSGNIARLNEQEGIINYMDNLGDVPIIYMGDMNSESPNDYTNLSESSLGTEPIDMILNPSHPKSSTVHTFVDVFDELNSDFKATYPSFDSRIDFIFANQHFADYLVNSTIGDTQSANLGSDHFSVDVFIDLSNYISDETIVTYTPSGSNGFSLPINWYFIIPLMILPVFRRNSSIAF